MKNWMELSFLSRAENESFARMAISAFLTNVDPTISLISEVRTAVSEAVTNAVVHAYEGRGGRIILRAKLNDDLLEIEVEDFGKGIADIAQAMKPFYTSKPDSERTGIGFALMQSFMDEVRVQSKVGEGTHVFMSRLLRDEMQDGE